MTIDIHNGIPNLDEQTEEDLEVFSALVTNDPTDMLNILFPDHPLRESLYAINKLGDYANAKMWYLRAIAQNKPIKAEVHQEQCKNIFSNLPPYARWASPEEKGCE